VGLIFFALATLAKISQKRAKFYGFRYFIAMNNEVSEQSSIDLVKIKADIASMNELPITAHSAEFEKIHKQLQQALTNLDGV
jgi:hypothetical protein